MKFLVAIAFIFCFISEGFTQKSLSDYSFVIVPEKFDFVNEADKYQLNSLTKFLFNKHGFNAFYITEMPDVRRCDGLWAQVDGKPAMIRTKVVIILNDCNGSEVYRSEVGTSKLKEYSKTYTAALRDAFLSIEELGVDQKEPEIFGASKTAPDLMEETPDQRPVEIAKEVEKLSSAVTEDVKTDSTTTTVHDQAIIEMYKNNGANFILRGDKKGYSLFEKTDNGEKLKGTLLVKDDKRLQFVDTSGNTFPGYFDAEKNLIIETSFQKMVFERVPQ